jgi:hypothetical protein
VTDKLSEHQGQVGFLNRIHSTWMFHSRRVQ